MDSLSGFRIALFGFLVVGGAWASYWAKIKALTVPRDPRTYQLIMAAGVLLSLWGLVLGAGFTGGALALLAVIAGGMFIGTSLISKLPDKTVAVSVGDRMPEFSALDSEGQTMESASLAGRSYLLKFYRGHW